MDREADERERAAQPADMRGGVPLDGDFRLWTWAPDRPPGGSLPILIVLDGARFFPSVAQAVAMLSARADATGVGPMLVAGLDHAPADPARRDADYTFGPCRDPAGLAAPLSHGGGEAMLERLGGPVLDALLARGGEAARIALFGHSLSGQFVLQALARRPGSYRAGVAISPSLWWHRDGVLAGLETMPDEGQAVFLGAGEREEPPAIREPADERRIARGIVSNARAAAEVARRRLGPDRVALHVAPDEDHASAPLALLPAALRFVAASFGQARRVAPPST